MEKSFVYRYLFCSGDSDHSLPWGTYPMGIVGSGSINRSWEYILDCYPSAIGSIILSLFKQRKHTNV